MKSRV